MKNVLLSPYDTLGTDYTNPCEVISYSTDHYHHEEQVQQTASSFKLYPNPNNGNMTFEYSLQQGEFGQLIMYNVVGQLINTYSLQEGADNKLQISESALKNSVYFYKVLINNVVVKSDKLVIIK